MIQGITFKIIWRDDDMYEFQITSSDGISTFINKVYVGYDNYNKMVSEIYQFKNHIYGGIYDIQFGEFGPEYASGAFVARLHFQELGKIYVSIHAQSEFIDFGKKNIASEVKLFFTTEPVLLDNFIEQLKLLKSELVNEASLEIF
ncbi:MAG: hypothetical protein I8H98_04875 [Moraxellaceae bacterium]|uniref:Uncharacterized protein n=1 Tax=Acinetobacter tjernbergiae DSM 14971 = CIP 107465 TaxID=1120928 RepID=V2UVP7_9GAMM|nr:hypothetical protein [Acinetobacter tjernbergiae]ESK54087.1 hypothetical protein F990_02959 [Acinetobacter tjernbergiae DSM 14971 = CIP 107465]MBH2001587.1 hypothetical protein [Moraxellaceae bacterium]MBH2029884.1 hypothetical protein [Moraxellaceae bacterium]